MELKTSEIHRRLDAKFKIGSVEASDLLSVLLLAAVMNLVLGRVPYGAVLIFGIPAALFVGLYFGKRGKPDGYLQHAIKFYLSSGELRAGNKEDHR
ncbi:MAG: hypothetical protein B7Y39_00765 [Bdellovibrio sp. 28-41-41]|nr:MAG: hypothetical protein B7Y39_00765 [Bdellovibrio sp. 28-41-41]